MIRLQNEPKSDTKQAAAAAAGSILAFLEELAKERPQHTAQFITIVLSALNYGLMPGVMEILAGEEPKENPTQDTLRFAALFLHNMILNGTNQRHSTMTIIEHTTREYAVRYEMLSDIGEKILKRMRR